jgi:uncharacterized membrane protein HdeD (DUF308 family)
MSKNLGHLRIGKRLARNWWTLALRGILAIIFGLTALFWTEFTLPILVFLFAIVALSGGVLLAIAAFKYLTNSHGWFLLIEGAIGIAVGVMPFIWPDVTALVLLYLTAAWAIITGIFEIIAANYVRREVENEWLVVGSGIASIVFGLLLVIWPLAQAMTIVWIIAAYAIVFGTLMLVFALRRRRWGKQLKLL